MSEQHNGNADTAQQVHWLYSRETLPQPCLAGRALPARTIMVDAFADLHAKSGFADNTDHAIARAPGAALNRRV